ncbi:MULTISPECIES: hypothetical protein [Halomonas]|uniref:hypothetical protein n=1 Tax=Halomonas TaxID=2745 RepID=UPI003CF1B861
MDKQHQNGEATVSAKPDMWLMYILIFSAWAAVLVGGYFMNSRIAYLEENQTQIVVADVGGMAEVFPYLENTEDINELMDRMDEVISTMADAGFVVINQQSVLDAPEHLRVSSEFMMRQAGIDLNDYVNAGEPNE